jgi:hypothetical protein
MPGGPSTTNVAPRPLRATPSTSSTKRPNSASRSKMGSLGRPSAAGACSLRELVMSSLAPAPRRGDSRSTLPLPTATQER